MRAPVPPNETERLAALKRHYILDTPPEAALDRITTLAARLFAVPISLVSLVDETRQWFKSAYGLDVRETPREIAFCAHAIGSDDVMVVTNAAEDARFHDNPLVQGAPDIRFYAGAPLTTPDGYHLGTLCIIDRTPRDLTSEQQVLLQNLAATVMDELELRLATITASRRQEDHTAISQRLSEISDRLQLSEDILQKVLEALPVGVWIADKEGTILHGNPAGRAIWSGSALVPISRYDQYVAWWADTGESIKAEDWALARAVRRGEISIDEVIRIQAFDGSQKTVLNSAVPLRGASGEIAGAIAVNEDITERRRAEEALRRTKDELEGLIQASPLAVICFDREGRVVRWNPAAEHMFGWSASEVIGKSSRIIPDNLGPEYEQLRNRILHGESFQEFETLRKRKDGTIINVSISAAALHGASGEITGILALLADTTARKATDAALIDSEERYRTLVDLSPNAISVHDGLKVLFVNPAAARMFGARDASEIVGRDPLEFSHPDFHATFRERTRKVIEDGATTELVEIKLRRLDGNEIDAEVISLPYRFHGRPAVQVVMRDITDRKRAEAEARKHERSLAALAENLPAFLAIKDRDLRYVIANRLFCDAVGCPPEQVEGKTDFDLFDAEHAAKYRADDQAVLRTGERLYVEEDTVLPNSAIRAVGTIKAPLRTANGEVNGLVAMAFDLTERKRLESDLRVSEERFRRAITDAPIPVMIHSSDGRILQINHALSQLSGYGAADLATMQDWIAKARPGAGQEAQDEINTLYNLESRSEGCEIPITTKSGQTRFWAFSSAPLGRDANGNRIIITMAMDTTERKALEQQLAQAQKMEAVGQLAGGVAHDFNNLLTVIGGYSGLLLQSIEEPDPARQQVKEIAQAAERATALTRQLLAFSRKQILQPSNVNINDIVLDSEKMLKRLIGENIEIRLGLSPDELRATVDPGQLVQVIMNLAVNARDAMPDGGVLTIETTHSDLSADYAEAHPGVKPGAYVQLAISDNGTGMDRATRDRIFEPFFTTKGPGTGTGLGLSTVYGIVKQSNGHITVYSESGRGTTFRVYLPRVFEVPLAGAKPSVTPLRGTETVLLVEDDPALRRLTKTILASAGYKVIEAANGGEALLACEQYRGQISLMITDVIMPGMSGRELAGRLRPLRPEMKVLYMSGYTDRAVVVNGALDEGLDFLQKPFTSESLKQRVRAILDASRG